MKKPTADYRQFRLSKLNTPQFSHLKLLLGWVGYFVLFFLTEKLIPREACYVVYSPLDDCIPFCEWFLIPYVFWYGLIVFAFYPAIIVVRLKDEEALLTRELPGYAQYKQKVKYRILPYIW